MVDTAALLVDEGLPPVPIRQWVLSVPFPLRFLFAREPAVLSAVLGIVIRAIEARLVARAGYTCACAQTGAVTLIQRFGSALNLNIHFHMLFLDGVYATAGRRLRFVPLPAATPAALQGLLERITHRVGRHLERRGLLLRDADSAYLQWDEEGARPLDELHGAAITYRIAVGPQCGQKAFTLQTLPPTLADEKSADHMPRTGGFSLHAGIAVRAHQREKLARLAALVPRPRVNLTRFHGMFAPNSRYRAQITPAARGRQSRAIHTSTCLTSPRQCCMTTPLPCRSFTAPNRTDFLVGLAGKAQLLPAPRPPR
jgi:hypothetical protein